ncbi:hypothetical protein C5471_12960 [Photorhabdus tasmaniensis]|uniref:Type II toxin-antitoxin system RelE/ParE family toxin n=1 Tax=Photorhabdus tasmaniensis TaxID=1004159 RepID=A0ABX0GJU4_9GAMM|nr:hypothetical protein [Photorhabdus tasmaniensis]
MRLNISPLAAQDIEEIGDYIAQDNPVKVVTFIQQCCQISEAPQIYRQRKELGESIRSCTPSVQETDKNQRSVPE